MESLVNYKKKIVSRFFAIEGANALQDLPESDEYIYSEKIDGHLAFAVVVDGKTVFYNRSATKLDLPHLEAAFPLVPGIWAGELYIAGDRSRNFQVASAIANDKENLRFAVFDAIHEVDHSIQDRMVTVTKNIPLSSLVHPVKWTTSQARKEIAQLYTDTISDGKEGLVVHTNLGYTYKLKPFAELDVTVLGYSQKEDGPGIRSLLVGIYHEGHWIVVASVGGGYTEETRVEWAERLMPSECEADIVLVASNKLAYRWVTPTIVIQIKCIEIISEDSSGIIRKDKLSYENGQYKSHQKTNAVSLISPVYLGVRTDKIPGAEDTGMRQFAQRLEMIASNDDETTLPNAEIICREVYIKESKTGTAVRKFVGMKTNKTLEQGFSPYQLYLTDFSAGRKEPLQTEIRVASSETILMEILAACIIENIKKGWEKVG